MKTPRPLQTVHWQRRWVCWKIKICSFVYLSFQWVRLKTFWPPLVPCPCYGCSRFWPWLWQIRRPGISDKSDQIQLLQILWLLLDLADFGTVAVHSHYLQLKNATSLGLTSFEWLTVWPIFNHSRLANIVTLRDYRVCSYTFLLVCI